MIGNIYRRGAIGGHPQVNRLMDDNRLVVLNHWSGQLSWKEKVTGWEETHIIQAPLSSGRFNAGVVSAMQKKRIVGVTSSHVIISLRR